MVLKDFGDVLARVKAFPARKRCGAVAPDKHTVRAMLDADREGLAEPVFIGDEAEITRMLADCGAGRAYRTVPASGHADAAARGAALAGEGAVDFLLKGGLETSVLLKAVVSKDAGLGTGRLMSHLAFVSAPFYHKMLVITDGGMVIRPDIAQKQAIIENAAGALRALGYECPKVACLAAVEKVHPGMPETADAAELKRRSTEGQLAGCLVDGPVSFDLAVSRESAALKGYSSLVAGDADILLVPDIASGNILGKALLYAAGARMAGLVAGARCPVIVTSRSSTSEEKFLSIALSALLEGRRVQ
jgi:phosphate butyryltransferase